MTNRYRNLHRQFIADFIDLYRSFPTLWDLKSPEYNDRDSKRDAYVKMVEKLQEIEPGCSKVDVIKKINSLRSAFRREHNKVKRFKACGRQYKSKLWYYDLISFTAIENITNSGSTVDGDKVDSNSEASLTSPDPLTVPLVKRDEDVQKEDVFLEDYSAWDTGEDEALTSGPTATGGAFKFYQDEFDAVGYNVASKLRNMDKTQRVIAERIIAETLFQGQMRGLTVSSSSSDFVPVVGYKPE